MKSSHQIKRELYHRVRGQVDQYHPHQDREVKKLENSMNRLSEKNWKRMATKEFDHRLQNSRVIFWGDFHGVRQFPRNLLRYLQRMEPSFFEGGFVLGVECLPVDKQKWVDRYLKHEISEDEFIEKSKWKEVWGFPWEHYRPLFIFAKEKGIRLLALNSLDPSLNLKRREELATQLIRQELAKNSKAKVWVLYGEFHLLPNGFPRLWKKFDRVEFILQNFDALYFKHPPRSTNSAPVYLKFESHYLCVQSVAPWIKWQTYLLFLESRLENDFDEELEVNEHVFDVAQTLAKEMQWKCLPGWFQSYRTDDHVLWQKMKLESVEVRRLFERFIQEELSFTSFTHGWSHLSRLSVNEVGGLAFLILWHQNQGVLTWPDKKQMNFESWRQLIWIFAWVYFGSKLHNPHRKTPSLLEIQAQSKRASQPFERQAARLVVNMMLQEQTGRMDNIFETTPSDRVRFLGLIWRAGLLGERIFTAHSEGRVGLSTLKAFLAKAPSQKHFSEIWNNLEEAIS